MIITTVFGFIYTGREGVGFMRILENADAVTSLLWGSFAMAMSGVVLSIGYKIMTFKESMDTFIDGMKLMTLTAAILLMAWSLGQDTKDMGLANFLVDVLGESIPAWILTITIFVLGMVVSFATGTSWACYVSSGDCSFWSSI